MSTLDRCNQNLVINVPTDCRLELLKAGVNDVRDTLKGIRKDEKEVEKVGKNNP